MDRKAKAEEKRQRRNRKKQKNESVNPTQSNDVNSEAPGSEDDTGPEIPDANARDDPRLI